MELALKFSKFREILISSPDSSAGEESACSAGEPGSIPGSGRPPEEGIGYPLQYSWAFLVAQMAKNLPAVWENWVWSLGWEDPLEEGMATHSSMLAWRIPMDKGAWWAAVHVATTEKQPSTIPLKGVGEKEMDFWLGAVSSACSVLGLSRDVILQESC